MKLINTTSIPIRKVKELYFFGGHNLCISTENIKTVECLIWDSYEENKYIPVLLFTLNDGTQLSIDFDSIEEAEEVLKEYKKTKMRVL